MDVKLLTKRKVELCCGAKRCPTVEVTVDGMVTIKDDFGSMVVLNYDQALAIGEGLGLMDKPPTQ